MKVLSFFLIFFSFTTWATLNRLVYMDVFSGAKNLVPLKIDDPISDKPINTTLFKVQDKDDVTIGYIRDITTTTGCDSACLPIIFTLFYNEKKMLIKIKSIPGLTKKFHMKFTDDDYEKLNLILALNPSVFLKVGHPTEMVDAISGATKTEYQDSVVKNAAYTSLRVNKYNQHTLDFLKTL